MISSLVPFAVATLGAIAMALAFPKTNAAVLAPLGAAGLFWAWFGASPIRAFWIGWVAGATYFTLSFWWFGETAGALIAPFGFLLTLGPAIGDAFFGFALVGVLVSFVAQALRGRRRIARAIVPLGAAAAFAFGEWLRGEGLGEIAVPFAELGYTQTNSPLAPVAAFAGVYGVTFLVCAIGAYAAYALRMRPVRGSGIDALAGFGAVVACVALAWTLWPARSLAPPAYRVAAVQGNIAQKLKFTRVAFAQAVTRYESLTARAASDRPQLVVWPETVVTTALNESPEIQARFATLARAIHAELVVGTFFVSASGEYNVLYFFRPDGGLDAIYRKRQLVPFAEHLPFPGIFGRLPWAREISHFSSGTDDGVVTVDALRFGPIVCWESAFSDLVGNDVRDGASALIISTDDAWFGTTAGPYQHAQIAQMRALETGRWIVRAASTGISGIIAPNGRYTQRSGLDEETVVSGTIGDPVDTAYDHIGGKALAIAFVLSYLLVLGVGRWRRI
jgi:apolipoprotein N-acyltransferase